MLFENFSSAWAMLLGSSFLLAVILGLVVQKTNFCTMGAVSDWVNIGDKGRIRAWMLAIAVALLGVTIFETQGLITPDLAFPPYRSGTLIWAENMLGGFLFGVGMTYGSGCGNKTLIRIGGGNLKSVMVFLLIGVIAYFMLNAMPGTDQTLFSLLFNDWIRPLAITFDSGAQDFGTIVAGPENAASGRLWVGLALSLAMFIFIFKSADFRSNFNNILGGLVVGLVIIGAWYVTSSIRLDYESDFDGEVKTTLREYLDPTTSQWEMAEDVHAGWEGPKPSRNSGSPMSFTFINPLGQTVGYIFTGMQKTKITFGVAIVFGVILGSLLWTLLKKGFRIEWFSSVRDFFNHLIGGILMGFGGVLALGCTFGQGITGVSTLALGSYLALISIVFGSALTMKVQYYKMVYEDAGFFAALASSLVDLRLLPSMMRKLEKV
ncbi:MAG: YeeE/YedE family protein [Gammaproteobacteria bacterium]|nr:YeeE/YedE family protein [Gammaproteobacteria bacterium]